MSDQWKLPTPYRCECPHCYAHLMHNGTRIGHTVKCPSCGKPFPIPEPESRIPEPEAEDTGGLQPVMEPHKPGTETTGQSQKVMQLSSAQKKVVAVGLVIMVLVGLFPPWRSTYRRSGTYASQPVGYHLIFDPPSGRSVGRGYHIDLSRLCLQCLLVAVVFGGIAFLVPEKSLNALWNGLRGLLSSEPAQERARKREEELKREEPEKIREAMKKRKDVK